VIVDNPIRFKPFTVTDGSGATLTVAAQFDGNWMQGLRNVFGPNGDLETALLCRFGSCAERRRDSGVQSDEDPTSGATARLRRAVRSTLSPAGRGLTFRPSAGPAKPGETGRRLLFTGHK